MTFCLQQRPGLVARLRADVFDLLVVGGGITGAGIAHQIGLGPLVDGYAACHTQFLPFCF